MTAGDSPALGNVWRLTAKKSDFYLDPVEDAGTFHLSAHGPNERFEGHRFHVKLDRRLAASANERGRFVEHSLPRRGFAFDGQHLDDGVFLVARIGSAGHGTFSATAIGKRRSQDRCPS